MRFKAGFRAAVTAALLVMAAALASAILYPPSPSTGAADGGYITDVDGNDEEGGTYASTQTDNNVFEAVGETSNVNRAYSYIVLQYNVSGLNVTADKITMMEFSARYCHSGMDAYAANMCIGDPVEHTFNGAQDVFVWNAAPGGTWVDIGDLSTTDGGVEVLGGWNATGTLSNYVNATTGYVTVRYEIQTNAPGSNNLDAWLAIDYAALKVKYNGSRLDVWDSADPEGGGVTPYIGDTVSFWANYSNETGYPVNSTVDSAVNCSINVYNATGWTGWLPMSYASAEGLFRYDMDGGFQQEGTWAWNVSCGSRIYANRTANDTVAVRLLGTNLTVWDATDSEGGGILLQAGDDAMFWANYTNTTGYPVNATNDPTVNCSINVYNVTAWTGWRPMNYSTATNLYQYNMTGGFAANGTYAWNVTCNSARYENRRGNDTIRILPLYFANLTIWDETDPEGGSHLIWARDNISFWANYTNETGYPMNSTIDPQVNCSINIYNVTQWSGWNPMTYDADSGLYEYLMAGGFRSNGTWQWNVTCTTRRYLDYLDNNTAYVRPLQGSNLTIWDNTDPFGGGLLLQADDKATFFANYSVDNPVRTADRGYVTDVDGNDEQSGSYTNTLTDDNRNYVVGERDNLDRAMSYIVLEYNLSRLNIHTAMISMMEVSASYCHGGQNGPKNAVCDGLNPIELTLNGTQDVEAYDFANDSWMSIGELNATDGSNEVRDSWNATGNLSRYISQGDVIRVRYEMNTEVGGSNQDGWLLLDYATVKISYWDTSIGCNITVYNVTGWTGWRTMAHNSTLNAYQYDMADGFAANGTYPWNVTCSGSVYQDQARNDTILIRPPWPTNLTVWDETDPAGGGVTRRPYETAMFFANYTNATGYPVNATVDATTNCSINIYNVTAWTDWRPMNYSAATKLYYYNMTGGFGSDGAWQWNVSCMSRRYGNKTGNDTIAVNKIPSNLTVWDAADPQAGSQTLFTYDYAMFFANYTNSSGYPINATADPAANCSISIYNVTAWTGWRPMTYSTASRLYQYNMTGGFAANGTWSWNVSCMSMRYDNKTANATIAVMLRLTNLTLWDDTDQAGGSRLVWASENLTFWANYTNTTGYPVNTTVDPTANCSINIYNVTAWTGWRPMNYSAPTKLYYYNMTGGFGSNGTWSWNVSCYARTYQNWTKNDTAYIRPLEPTNLTLWDDTDPAGGSRLIWASENATFFANYTNATGYPVNATLDPAVNCSINIYNVTAWTGWRPMNYSAPTGLYWYNMTGGFGSNGTWSWNVSCYARKHQNWTKNDTAYIRPLEPSNLTLWDNTDPQGGSQLMYARDNVTFWANYTNTTGYPVNATLDPAVNCSINIYNVTAWTGWRPMNYSMPAGLYWYNMTGGFSTNGTWAWNVSCYARKHQNWTKNDSIVIGPPIPTNLTLWDDADPQGGSLAVYAYENATFYANYTNTTGYPINASIDPLVNCSINMLNVTAWTGWLPMSFNPAARLYQYTMAGGFAVNGTWDWNVSCMSTRYENRTGNTTITVQLRPSNLTLWDDTDPQAGGKTVYAYDAAVFWANYTNATGYPVNATLDPAVNCSINIYNVTAWTGWRPMNYSMPAGLYWYNMTGGFGSRGVWQWNVSCQAARYENKSGNDTIFVKARANLTVWDDTDPAGGSLTVYSGEDVSFWADYTNATGYPVNATLDQAVNCSVNIYNATTWTGWLPMSYDGGSGLYRYLMAGGFPSKGTWQWNVSCGGLEHENRTGNDTVRIMSRTELRIWDESDPEAGVVNIDPYEPASFWANYTNATGYPVNATLDADAECRVRIYNVSGWTGWIQMTYAPATGLYKYNMTGGFNQSGLYGWNVSCTAGFYQNRTASDTIRIGVCANDSQCGGNECCNGICQPPAQSCCGRDGCESGEDYLGCQADCCEGDCSGEADGVCRTECAGYNGCGTVSAECAGLAVDSCADAESDCVVCEHRPCQDFACTASCYGNRWRSAPPVDNTCSGGTCSQNECAWGFTCNSTLAIGCGTWQCDGDGDCADDSVCSSSCRCLRRDVTVNSTTYLVIQEPWDFRDWVWFARG